MSTIDYASIHRMVIHFLVDSAEWFDGETRLKSVRYELEGLLRQVRIVLNNEEIKSPEEVDWEGFVRALKLEAVPDILKSLKNTTSAIHNATGGCNDFFNPDKELKVAFETLRFLKIASNFSNYLTGAVDEHYEFPCGKRLERFLKSLEQLSPELQMALHYDNKNIGVARARIEVLKLVNCFRTIKEAANGLGIICGGQEHALETIHVAYRAPIEAAIFNIDKLNDNQDPVLALVTICTKGILMGKPNCFQLLDMCLSSYADLEYVSGAIKKISEVEIDAVSNAGPDKQFRSVLSFNCPAVGKTYLPYVISNLKCLFENAINLGLVTIENRNGAIGKVLVSPLVTARGKERVMELAIPIVSRWVSSLTKPDNALK